jgi:uncharacterized damage-inducible protein DinB
MEDLRFPVGRFDPKPQVPQERRAALIDEIARAPDNLRRAVTGLSDEQLDTPYREGGWTVRQVVHHVPDSHMNAYVRFKLALTEDEPTIRPYNEKRWAELADTTRTPVDVSLALLDSLHERWVTLLRAMTAEDFDRKLEHPEHGMLTLAWMLRLYEWHGRHHVAHVTSLRERNGW